jgi:prophage tail gpP-like protein
VADTTITLDTVQVTATPTPSRGAPPPPDAEELLIVTGGQRLSGWLDAIIGAGVEEFPRHFHISTTERYPGEIAKAIVRPRAACQVYLINQKYRDKIIDGYIDRYIVELDKDRHFTRLIGRGKCEDLVDSAMDAFATGWVIQATSIKQVAELLAKPFGITVLVPDGDVNLPPPMQIISVFPGYTVFALLEEFCRSVARLLYEDQDGNLVIAKVSNIRAGSALTEGVNVKRLEAIASSDQRFARYVVLGQNRNLSVFDNILGERKDPQAEILGHRLRIIPAETPDINLEFSQQRAQWEANRRFGRSMEVRCTVVGWRDGSGQLWKPNTIVSCRLPSAKISEDRCITAVQYLRGERGTEAVLTLMPPKALDVQPFTIFSPV